MANLDVTATPGPFPIQMSRCAAEVLTVTSRPTPSGAVVVVVRGEVDMTTCSLLRDRLIDHLRSTHQLVLDLGGVRLLCAAGLTALLVVRETALLTGTSLCLVARTRPVRRPLMITELADVFDLHADVAGALLCPSARGPLSPAAVWLADPHQPGGLW